MAALVRARTRRVGGRDSSYADTFLDPAPADPGPPAVPAEPGTRPTATQVGDLIAAAVAELSAATGGVGPCSEGLREAAGSFVRYRAAQLVEISYYPEISEGDTSAAQALGRIADGMLTDLARSIVARCGTGGDPEDPDNARPGMPSGQGPVCPIIGRDTPW